MRRACLVLCALAHLGAYAAPVISADQRAARDAQRLDVARTQRVANDDARSGASATRARRTASLKEASAQLDALTRDNEKLDDLARALGDDLSQVDALARSALQAQQQRLTVGPLAVSHHTLRDQSLRSAERSAGLDMLYASWFSLHEEWLAAGTVARMDTLITRADGDRRSGTVQRVGAVGLMHQGRVLQTDRTAGLIEPPLQSKQAGGSEFVRQQVFDAGFIGVILLLCGVLGSVMCVRQIWRSWGAQPSLTTLGRRQSLGLIASAALLLGLLGTVVGLIHTFRALAHYGGADASIAAAGISHALSTTWLGLTIAIPLMLLQAAVNALPPPAQPVRRAPLRAARRYPPHAARLVLGVPAALLFGFGLFFFMQWLTQRPLVDVVAAEPLAPVARIDWTPPPPPRPPPPATRAAPRTNDVSTNALDLPALAPLPPAAAKATLPQLALGDALGKLGGGGPAVGAGTLWNGAAGGGQIIGGSDLVPISSARPRYPRPALEAGLEGWVEAIFIIDADGSVRDVRIIDADPAGVFEQAAAAALTRWLYAPFYQDGQPVAREATQLLRFSLDDARDTYVRRPNE